MKSPQRKVAGLFAAVFALGAISPAASQDWNALLKRRQASKNDWRNIAIGAGAVSVLGLIKKDSILTFAGAAGALYAAWRYEEDRKSHSRLRRARAAYFSKPYFTRNGKKYVRRTVYRKGVKYYRFVRA